MVFSKTLVGACAIEKYFKILFLYGDRDTSYCGAFLLPKNVLKGPNIEKNPRCRSITQFFDFYRFEKIGAIFF